MYTATSRIFEDEFPADDTLCPDNWHLTPGAKCEVPHVLYMDSQRKRDSQEDVDDQQKGFE